MSLSSDLNTISTSLTAIKNAIIAKGVTPSGNITTYATAIGNISGGGSSTLITKSITQNGTYNASSDNADGYSSVTVNVSGGAPQNIPLEIDNGNLQKPASSFTYSMPSSVTDIGFYALNRAFKLSDGITSLSFSSNLTDISGDYACQEICNEAFNFQTINWGGVTAVSGYCGMQNAFGASGVTSINIPIEDVSGNEACLSMFGYCPDLQSATLSLINVSGNLGCAYMFQNCGVLDTVNISALEAVSGDYGLQGMFEGCESLVTLTFSALEELASGALTGLCSSCISLTTLSFPSLTTLADDTVFDDMLVDCENVTVHFPSALQSTIENYQSVLDGFGGTNTTILFDL